jgi:hypothetical protein
MKGNMHSTNGNLASLVRTSVIEDHGMKLYIWDSIPGYESFMVFASSTEEAIQKCEESMMPFEILKHLKDFPPCRIVENKPTIIAIRSNIII